MTGTASVLLGTQWGDEGKGKITDGYGGDYDAIVRFNGGANAGHTLIVGDKRYVTHMLPSGIIRQGQINIVGPGAVCDLEMIRDELKIAETMGATVLLDRSAPIVLPIHKLIDRGREKISGAQAIGTTARGIGPSYEDFWARRCLRLGDLTSKKRIEEHLRDREYYIEKMALATHLGQYDDIASLPQTAEWLMQFSEMIRPLLVDSRAYVLKLLKQGKDILFEGAQGILLDTIFGAQPFTTSSVCTPAGISSTFGIYNFAKVIGVTKAYTTRVGAGPFPTEQDNEVGEQLRREGSEFGATTGRPRRCGWLDLVALKYACRVGNITELTMTKLDILSEFSEIKVCTDYLFEGTSVQPHETLTGRVMREAEPYYTTLAGWEKDISHLQRIEGLPTEARDFLTYVSDFVGRPITHVGVGPERRQLL